MQEVNAAFERLKRRDARGFETPSGADTPVEKPRPHVMRVSLNTLFVASESPVLLIHPLTYVQPIHWPDVSHPNVIWFSADLRTAVKIVKPLVRSSGLRCTSEGGELVAFRGMLKSRMPIRPRRLQFADGTLGTCFTVFGSDLRELRALFDFLRRCPGVAAR
jgi:hypothetical protein